MVRETPLLLEEYSTSIFGFRSFCGSRGIVLLNSKVLVYFKSSFVPNYFSNSTKLFLRRAWTTQKCARGPSTFDLSRPHKINWHLEHQHSHYSPSSHHISNNGCTNAYRSTQLHPYSPFLLYLQQPITNHRTRHFFAEDHPADKKMEQHGERKDLDDRGSDQSIDSSRDSRSSCFSQGTPPTFTAPNLLPLLPS